MARERSKAANGTGSITWRNGKPFARVSLPDGRRKRIPIPAEFTTDERRRDFAAACAEKVRGGLIVFDEPAKQSSKAEPATTVREVMKVWTSGELLKRYGSVNKLRTIASAKIIAWTLEKHAMGVKTRGSSKPTFGDLPVANVTTDDVVTVLAQHAPGRAQTKQHTYNRLHRLFDLAIFPLKLRAEGSNPVTRYLRPTSDDEKVFCFLYPDEVTALLTCAGVPPEKAIPIGRRILYMLAVYAGPRKGSLYALKWKGVDFVNGTITIPKTKNRAALFFAANTGAMAILRAWYELSGRPDADSHVVRDVGCERGKEAQALREDLRLVGVDRAVLFTDDDPNVEPLRFHDLRATFVTWAKREGQTRDWIRERTGHVTERMMDRYTRHAQTLADLSYTPFPDVREALPELARLAHPLAHPWVSEVVSRGALPEPSSRNHSQCEGGDLNPYGSNPASTSSSEIAAFPCDYVSCNGLDTTPNFLKVCPGQLGSNRPWIVVAAELATAAAALPIGTLGLPLLAVS